MAAIIKTDPSVKDLIEWEISFPSALADVCRKPYGMLYYNAENPRCRDSNHGVFSDFNIDLEQAVDDLILFYRLKSIIPRIYTSFSSRERELLCPILARRGFEFKNSPNKAYVKRFGSQIAPRECLRVQRVKKMDPPIRKIIKSDDGGDWNAEVISKHLPKDTYHFLIGYAGEIPVCTAALHIRQGFTRLDDVLTDKEFRGRGFGRALISQVLDYHDQLAPGNHLYLWASNTTAVKIYHEAGFRELNETPTMWEAWYAPISSYK